MRQERKAAWEEGRNVGIEEGRNTGIIEGRNLGKAAAVMALLEELGALPEELAVRLENESDPEILDRWVRLAAKADSLEMFRENM